MLNPEQTYGEQHVARADVELSFAVVARFFARRWRLALLVFTAAFVVGCLYFGTREDKYMARAVFMAPPDDGTSSKAILSSGLASLLDGNAGGSTSPEFQLFINSFGSMRLAHELARDQRIMHSALSDQWDERAGRWVPPKSIMQTVAGGVRTLMGRPSWREPTAFELRDYIERNVEIEQVPESQFWQISFEHGDPKFAKSFLEVAVRSTDNILRRRRMSDLVDRERFLRNKIATEQNTVVHGAIYELLSSVLATQVEMQGKQYYSISMLDPVYVLPDPASPRPSQVLVLSFLLAFSLALITILAMGIRRFLQKVLQADS